MISNFSPYFVTQVFCLQWKRRKNEEKRPDETFHYIRMEDLREERDCRMCNESAERESMGVRDWLRLPRIEIRAYSCWLKSRTLSQPWGFRLEARASCSLSFYLPTTTTFVIAFKRLYIKLRSRRDQKSSCCFARSLYFWFWRRFLLISSINHS